MKKILIASIVLIPIIYSCNRDYTCSCQYSSQVNGDNYDEQLYVVNGSEKEAIDECQLKSDTINDPGVDTISVICNLK